MSQVPEKITSNNEQIFFSPAIPLENVKSKNNMENIDYQLFEDFDCNLDIDNIGFTTDDCEGTRKRFVDPNLRWQVCQQPAIGSKFVTLIDGKTVKFCKYNLSLFSEENFINYFNKFGCRHDNDQYLFKYFCTLTKKDEYGNICPSYTDSNGNQVKNSKCMILRSHYYNMGNICRMWEKYQYDQNNEKLIFDIKKNWCENNKTEPDCKCLSRNSDKDYQEMRKVFTSQQDYCWYPPCKQGTNCMVDVQFKDIKCPNICEFVMNLNNVEHAKISNITSNMNCGENHLKIPKPSKNVYVDNVMIGKQKDNIQDNPKNLSNITKNITSNTTVLICLSLVFIFLLLKK